MATTPNSNAVSRASILANNAVATGPSVPPARLTVPMSGSRKFKALVLAIAVYAVPMIMTFILVLTKNARFEDLKEMVKWCGLSLSPVFVGYIGGTALEGWAERKSGAPPAPSAPPPPSE